MLASRMRIRNCVIGDDEVAGITFEEHLEALALVDSLQRRWGGSSRTLQDHDNNDNGYDKVMHCGAADDAADCACGVALHLLKSSGEVLCLRVHCVEFSLQLCKRR